MVCRENLHKELITKILNTEGCFSQRTNIFRICLFLLHLVDHLSSPKAFFSEMSGTVIKQSILGPLVLEGWAALGGFDQIILFSGWGQVKELMQHEIPKEGGKFDKIMLHQLQRLQQLRLLQLLQLLQQLQVLQLLRVLQLRKQLELLRVLQLLQVLQLIQVLQVLQLLHVLQLLRELQLLQLLRILQQLQLLQLLQQL